METLLAEGALDVWTTPVGMKKNRPGILLSVLCRPEDREATVRRLFRHTSTIGIRESTVRRYTLARREEIRETAAGPVRRKISDGYGVTRVKDEYEDLARIAREEGISLAEAKEKTR